MGLHMKKAIAIAIAVCMALTSPGLGWSEQQNHLAPKSQTEDWDFYRHSRSRAFALESTEQLEREIRSALATQDEDEFKILFEEMAPAKDNNRNIFRAFSIVLADSASPHAAQLRNYLKNILAGEDETKACFDLAGEILIAQSVVTEDSGEEEPALNVPAGLLISASAATEKAQPRVEAFASAPGEQTPKLPLGEKEVLQASAAAAATAPGTSGASDETQPRTAILDKPEDARKNAFINKVNKRVKGVYVMTDRDVAEQIEIFLQEDFQDTPQVQKMVGSIGQRYNFVSLRIPDERVYKAILKGLHSKARASMLLRENPNISPRQLVARVPHLLQRLDPRTLFDMYLDVLGYEKGKKVLESWWDKYEVSVQSDLLKPKTKEQQIVLDMVLSLGLYLKKQPIAPLMQVAPVKDEFTQWLKNPKAKGAEDLREGEIITTLPGVMGKIGKLHEKYDLDQETGFPLIQLALSLKEISDKPQEQVPDHLKVLAATSKPLMSALEELQKDLQSEGGPGRLLTRSSLELADDLAHRHGFAKSLPALKRELKDFVRPEDAHVIDPMFELYFEDEPLDIYNHMIRVTKQAYLIALEMGLGSKERQMILQSSLGHDLGKFDPDIAPLLELPRRLYADESKIVAEHGRRSREIAQGRCPQDVLEIMAYHNYVHGAKDSDVYKRLSDEKKTRFQRVLYVLYAADYVDALYDYSRSYQKGREPLRMKNLHEVVSMIESVWVKGEKHDMREFIDVKIVDSVKAALKNVQNRTTGKAKATPDQHERDLQFQRINHEALPYWALYEIIKAEKRNYHLWNVDKERYGQRILDRAKEQYFQRLWQDRNMSLAAREAIFKDIVGSNRNVAQEYPDFMLDLYMGTVLRFPDPTVYGHLEKDLERIKERIHANLKPKNLVSLTSLRRHVARQLRLELDNVNTRESYAAAMMLGGLGGARAIKVLEKAALLKDKADPYAWKTRLAAVDTLGMIYKHMEKRWESWEKKALAKKLSPEDFARHASARELHRWMEEIFRVLQQVAAKDFGSRRTSPRIRQRAMYVMRNVLSPRMRTISLDVAHKDPSWRVRYHAVTNLGLILTDKSTKVHHPAVLRCLVEALGDSESEVRWAAEEGLRKKGGMRVAKALLRALQDEHFDGRLYALYLLRYEILSGEAEKLLKYPNFVSMGKRQKKLGDRFQPTAGERVLQRELARLKQMLFLLASTSDAYYKDVSEAAEKLTDAQRQWIWMLRTLDQGKIARAELTPEMRAEFQEEDMGQAFFWIPQAEWQRQYRRLKQKTPLRYRPKVRRAWDDLRRVRGRFRLAAATQARKMLSRAIPKAKPVPSKKPGTEGKAPPGSRRKTSATMLAPAAFQDRHAVKLDAMARAAQGMGFAPTWAQALLQTTDGRVHGELYALHVMAFLEGIPPAAFLNRAILHERFHQVWDLMVEYGLLEKTAKSELVKQFKKWMLTQANDDQREISFPDLIKAFMDQYGTQSMQEMLFQHFHAKAAEAAGNVAKTDMPLVEGNGPLSVMHHSDYLETVTSQIAINAPNWEKLSQTLKSKLRQKHTDLSEKRLERLVRKNMRELKKMRLDKYPNLRTLLDVEAERAPPGVDPMRQKIRRLTRLVRLLGGETKVQLGDLEMIGQKRQELKQMFANVEKLGNVDDIRMAIKFIAALHDPARQFPAWQGTPDHAQSRTETLIFFAEVGKKESFLSALLTFLGDEPGMDADVGEAIWHVYKEAVDWKGQRTVMNLALLAADQALETLDACVDNPVERAALVERFFKDPLVAKHAAQHLFAGKAAREIWEYWMQREANIRGSMSTHRTGMAIAPILQALGDHVNRQKTVSIKAIDIPGNGMRIHSLLVFLEAVGWLDGWGPHENMTFSATASGRVALEFLEAFREAATFMPVAMNMQSYLFDPAYKKPDGAPSLGELVEKQIKVWFKLALSQEKVHEHAAGEALIYLDGMMIAPVMVALAGKGVFKQLDPRTHELDISKIQGNEKQLQEAFDVLVVAGWAKRAGNRVQLTPNGVLAVKHAAEYRSAVKDLAELAKIPAYIMQDGTGPELTWLLINFMPGSLILELGKEIDEPSAVTEQSP